MNLGLVWLKFSHCSVEQEFIILSIYLRNFDIISPWISVWLKVNPLYTRMLCVKFIKYVVLNFEELAAEGN